MNKKIIIIMDSTRVDNYNYLILDSYKNDYILLDLSSNKLISNATKFKFKSEISWKEFITPRRMINKIQPDKIIFFEIIDSLNISLMIVANYLKIETIYLEHGASNDYKTAFVRSYNKVSLSIKVKHIFKKLKNINQLVKNKIFFISSIFYLKSFKSWIKFFSIFFNFLSLKSLMLNLYSNKFEERLPKIAILFNNVNYKQFYLHTGIKKENSRLTGVPFFDNYHCENLNEENYIVFIDHPYYESNLFDWGLDFHFEIAKNLNTFVNLKKIKVIIKLHPRSDKALWEKYNLNSEFIEILQEGDFTELYLKSKLIIGYSSSLLNGFLCAKKNVVNIGWHPEPQIFGVDFSKTGLCHKSLDMNDLFEKYDFWIENNLALKNEDKYVEFLKEFNYPFDGNATQRILDIINS